jgi:hypothetical protein
VPKRWSFHTLDKDDSTRRSKYKEVTLIADAFLVLEDWV